MRCRKKGCVCEREGIGVKDNRNIKIMESLLGIGYI